MSACPSYKIDSNDTGLRFAVEQCLKELPEGTPAVAAIGTITFGSNAEDGDTITVGATTFTFVADSPEANEIQIGGDADATASNAATAIDGLPNVGATSSAGVVTITASVAGAAGNSIALAASDATVSGANLSGGVDSIGGAVWHPLEPNSYGDMGASITTVARNPINPSRQRQKGVVTDLEATASFQMDLTGHNHLYMMQSYNFALAREKPTTAPLNAAVVPVTAVTTVTGYAMNDSFASQLAVGDVLLAEGFGVAANNGVKVVTAVATGTVLAAGVATEASPPAGAKLTQIAVQGSAGDLAITTSGGQTHLTASTLNLSSLGLIEGEWIYIGGDAALTHFDNNQGFARVDAIAAGSLLLGKTSWTPVAEAGGSKTIQLFFGTVIRNEEDPDDIVRQPLQFERTLGSDADGVMSQYIIGSIANEFTLNVPQADKVTAEMGFVACDAVARPGSEGLKPGERPPLQQSDAFNTSSDVRRLAFSIVGEPEPLFLYATDLTITINNNASGAKAIGVLGNFDINIGVFDVGGSVTAYFQDVRAVNAVRDNADVSMDLILVKNNMGIVWDIPLMALGNGMVAVEQDQAITVPLDTMAAQSSFGHTLMYVNFPYLPNAA